MAFPAFSCARCSAANLELRATRASTSSTPSFRFVDPECLKESQVFTDMLLCCDASTSLVSDSGSGPERPMHIDLDETPESVELLLRLLHTPPTPPTPVTDGPLYQLRAQLYIPHTVIPLPILSQLFDLQDKYDICESDLSHSLSLHLEAYSTSQPLQVYECARRLGLHRIANTASQYLLHPPLATYDASGIISSLSIESYHKLVQLHDKRIKGLKSLILSEQLFPFGYGNCSSHSTELSRRWETLRVETALGVEAGTDVAAEMASILEGVDCLTCKKACNAALEMIAYKSMKLPRRIDQL